MHSNRIIFTWENSIFNSAASKQNMQSIAPRQLFSIINFVPPFYFLRHLELHSEFPKRYCTTDAHTPHTFSLLGFSFPSLRYIHMVEAEGARCAEEHFPPNGWMQMNKNASTMLRWTGKIRCFLSLSYFPPSNSRAQMAEDEKKTSKSQERMESESRGNSNELWKIVSVKWNSCSFSLSKLCNDSAGDATDTFAEWFTDWRPPKNMDLKLDFRCCVKMLQKK